MRFRIEQTHEDGMPDLEVRAFEEELNGNKISDFRKDPREPLDLRGPVTIRATEVRGQQIYFLNLSDRATTVTFCAANKIQQDPCAKKGSSANRFLVKPNQFLVVDVKKLPEKYFFLESSNPGRAILAKLVPTTGTTGEFHSESSISFGESAR
jgi:hypothetical protein